MRSEQIYQKLTEIFREVFNRDDLVITPELSAKDLEDWNSFKMIDIIMATEERFDIALATKDIDSLRSVGDLASIIAAKTKGN